MKEAFGAFASDVFRPIVTLTMPGAFAVWPYVIWQFRQHEALQHFADRYRVEAAIIALAVCVAAGMIVENLGSWIEVLLDLRRGGDTGRVWYNYLAHSFEKDREPVGHRYLRTMTLRMKFELGAACAFALSIPGVIWNRFPGAWAWLPYWLGGAAAFLIFIEASATHAVLCVVRREILIGAGKDPDAAPANVVGARGKHWFARLRPWVRDRPKAVREWWKAVWE